MAWPLVLHYERHLDAPPDFAYAWLTDYQDHDASLTGAIIEDRRVVERARDRVVLEGRLHVLGRPLLGRAEVLLFPPDRWEAHFRGKHVQYAYRYRLAPEAGGCRLLVEYEVPRSRKFLRRLGTRLSQRRILGEIDRMWDGFVGHLEKDSRATRGSSARAGTPRATERGG